MKKLKTLLVVLLLSCCAPKADQSPTPTIPIPEGEFVEAAALEKDLSKEGIQWYEMNAHAFLKAKSEGRIIMLYLHDDTCEPCVVFDRATLADPDVIAKVNQELIPVLVGDEMKQEIEKAFGQSVFPTVIFLRPTGEHLITIQGFVPPSKFKLVLEALTTYLPETAPQVGATPVFI